MAETITITTHYVLPDPLNHEVGSIFILSGTGPASHRIRDKVYYLTLSKKWSESDSLWEARQYSNYERQRLTGSYEAVGDKFDTIRAAFAKAGDRVLPATSSQPPQIKMNVIRAGGTISRPVAAWSNNNGSLSLKPALYGKDVLLAVESARGIHIADADPIIKSVMHTPTWKGEAKIAESHYNLNSADNRFTAL